MNLRARRLAAPRKMTLARDRQGLGFCWCALSSWWPPRADVLEDHVEEGQARECGCFAVLRGRLREAAPPLLPPGSARGLRRTADCGALDTSSQSRVEAVQPEVSLWIHGIVGVGQADSGGSVGRTWLLTGDLDRPGALGPRAGEYGASCTAPRRRQAEIRRYQLCFRFSFRMVSWSALKGISGEQGSSRTQRSAKGVCCAS